jgi:hypothetical protein
MTTAIAYLAGLATIPVATGGYLLWVQWDAWRVTCSICGRPVHPWYRRSHRKRNCIEREGRES